MPLIQRELSREVRMTQRLVAYPAGKSFFGSTDLLPAQASLTYAIWQKSPMPLHADSGYFITGSLTPMLFARWRVSEAGHRRR